MRQICNIQVPLLTTLLASAILLIPLVCYGLDWKNGEISAQYTGRVGRYSGNYVKGEGQGSFSLALNRSLQSSGDVTLLVKFLEDTVDPVLIGVARLDLGALSADPVSVSVPFFGGDNRETFQVGHYYLVQGNRCFTLLQILDFMIENRQNLEYDASAKCTVTFRYLSPYPDLKSLNKALAGKQTDDRPQNRSTKAEAQPQQKALPQQKATPPVKHLPTGPARKPQASTEAGPIAAAYEQFQQDAKAFMDLASEQATVSKCDVLLDTAKDLSTRINDQIGETDSTITGNRAKITSLNERLMKITDLQLRDRTQTRISKIKEETDLLQKDLKEWTAKLDELQKAEKKLREYRLIIGI